jgi:hypothetical protein
MTWAALEEEQGDPVRAEEIRNLYFQQVSSSCLWSNTFVCSYVALFYYPHKTIVGVDHRRYSRQELFMFKLPVSLSVRKLTVSLIIVRADSVSKLWMMHPGSWASSTSSTLP